MAKNTVKKTNTDIRSLLLLNSHKDNNDMNVMEYSKFRHILINGDTFQMFMMYLSKELSMQFLFAFIEIIQFQRYVWKLRSDLDIDDDFGDSLFQNIRFYSNMVKSHIVFCDDQEKYGG